MTEIEALRKAKGELRTQMARVRDALSDEARAAAGRAICERVLSLPAWQQARVVFLYVSFRTEVETRTLLAQALAEGKRVLAPRVNRAAGEIEACPIGSLEELAAGAWGILEPQSPPADPSEIDLVLLPGLAFDRQGGRLGYGAGYYDRYLRRLRPDCARIALAYEAQMVEQVPTGPGDQPVQGVVTEGAYYEAA